MVKEAVNGRLNATFELTAQQVFDILDLDLLEIYGPTGRPQENMTEMIKNFETR